MKKIFFLFMILMSVFSGCATSTKTVSAADEKRAIEKKYSSDIASVFERIESGIDEETVTEKIDPVIAYFEKTYLKKGRVIYCARTKKETEYLVTLAKEKKSESIFILPDFFARAYFLKAYALIDEKKYKEANIWIEKAIELAPSNSQYLSEAGHILQAEKSWQKAFDLFEKSRKMAEEFSPEENDLRLTHITRAMRGKAFSLTELGKLDEAEVIYKKCLELDSDDRVSKNELKYIKQLKSKKNQTKQQ